MTETTRGAAMMRQGSLSLILAASLIAALVYYVRTTVDLAVLSSSSNTNLLGLARQGRSVVTPALARVPAVAANPLSQQAVSGVIAARAFATGDTQRALQETGLLRQLGWRSTSALQNLLWRGGTTRDQALLMDTIDALLRREKLLGQIYPILNLMTTDAEFRNILTARLMGRPSWRRYYLQSASDLSKPDEIEGRYLVMSGVQHRGDRLSRNDVAPILPKLLAIGRGVEAADLWRRHVGALESPLADSNFSIAARPLTGDALPVVFEWQLGSGSGYFTEAARDERGNYLSIDWNGRGAPTFVSQVTTAQPGRYRLDVAKDDDKADLTSRLGFRLVCTGRSAIEFAPVGARMGSRVQLASVGTVGCAFPTLELYGLVQPGTSPGPMVLRSIKLQRSDR